MDFRLYERVNTLEKELDDMRHRPVFFVTIPQERFSLSTSDAH